MNGAIIGASIGFVNGVAGSALNSVINGGSIKLGQLLHDGLIGAVIGGAIQGIAGGIRASKDGGNFWSGEKITLRTTKDVTVPTNSAQEEPVEYSNKSAREFSDSHPVLKDLSKQVNELHADGTLPKTSKLKISGERVFDNEGYEVYGVAKSKVNIFGIVKNKVYLTKLAFQSRTELYLTTAHEYMHIDLTLNSNFFSAAEQHSVIDGWESDQYRVWGQFNKAVSNDIQYLKLPNYKLIRFKK